ncbi:PaaI family thioesterase [Chloroflexota bacterium]
MNAPKHTNVHNPFGELIGLEFSKSEDGVSQCSLEVVDHLLNPYGVVHGGVIYSLADTGMGGALYSLLTEREQCATVEIKIVYLHYVTAGALTCSTKVINKSRRLAYMESEIRNDERLVAKATGTFSIFPAKTIS